MGKFNAALILFAILLTIVFLVDYFVIKRRYLNKINGKTKSKKKLKSKNNDKNNELMELSYLIAKFKLSKEKLPMNKLLLGISLVNAIIISFVAVVVIIIDIHITLQLAIGFVLLFALIYSLYELLGRYLVKKGYVK